MQLARDIAGFTLAEGDILRKAIGKKNKELLLAQRDKFVKGCIKEGNGEELGNKLFDLIEKFALYGFNKSHAVGYAILAYQTAYLKANYPAEFMCALLNSEIGDLSRISKIIYDCDKVGIQVLPPSINKSDDKFSVENGKIRFGLQSIRNIGEDFAAEIKLQRPYLSLVDLCMKIHSKFYTSRKLESLISAGCFDEFGTRGGQIDAVETVNKTSRNNDYYNLFEPDIKISKDEFTIDELAKREREALGIYFLYNPLSKYSMEHNTISEIEEDIPNGFLCIVDEIKKKDKMAFIKVIDLDSAMECVAFASVLDKINFIVGDAYLINGVLRSGKFRIAKAIPLKGLE
jgi:DNA polymerase-3 subunit alpha